MEPGASIEVGQEPPGASIEVGQVGGSEGGLQERHKGQSQEGLGRAPVWLDGVGECRMVPEHSGSSW